MAAPVELDLRLQDTYLAADVDAIATSLTFGHDASLATILFPLTSFWVVIEPDDPGQREDVLVRTMAGAVATVRRNFTASPPGTGRPHKVGSPVRLATRAGCVLEPFHLVDTAGEPAFANAWVNFAGGNAGARFAIDPFGVVHLSGLVKSGGIPNTIYTLPAGYRPLTALRFAIVSNGLFGQCNVLSTGDVQAIAGSNVYFSLEEVTFKAEQ